LIADVRHRIVDPQPIVRAKPLLAVIEKVDDEEQRASEREREGIQRDLQDRVKDLEMEIECAQGREEAARRLVEEYAKVQIQVRYVHIQKTACLKADLISQPQAVTGADGPDQVELQDALKKQKDLLDEERRKFTEAAVRLGQERRQLEVGLRTRLVMIGQR
jgi:hypothetical protein